MTMKKILVAYFSRTGNTRKVAGQIQKMTGGDIFEIQVVVPYPDNYDAAVKLADQERKSNDKPELKTQVDNIKNYDVIFIGHPIWWSGIPAPIRSFLSDYDFSGKIIAPFCTHEGSKSGHSVADISKLCPGATVLEGLAIRHGEDAKKSEGEVSEWLGKINVERLKK
jgi:flavodoxin